MAALKHSTLYDEKGPHNNSSYTSVRVYTYNIPYIIAQLFQLLNPHKLFFRMPIIITRNRSLSNIGRARCAAINSDFYKIIISKYINYTIGINDNNCVFVCNLILGW